MCNQYRVFLVAATTALSIFYSAPLAKAQFDRIPLVDKTKTRAPVRIIRPTVITKVIQKPVIQTKIVRVSNLIVTTEPGATVILDSVRTAKPFHSTKKASDQGAIIFDDIKAGEYKVQVSKDGFETKENDKVTIVPQKEHVLTMDLKPVTYKLKIQTNVHTGEVFYAKADETAKNTQVSISAEQLGNYCVVKIQPNGETEVSDLKKGYYFIDIHPGRESPEFEILHRDVNIPEDIDVIGGVPVAVTLDKKISTETFSSTAWIPADWILPPAWNLDRGMKVKNAEGIATPRNERYRYYVNFEMIADIKLKDDGTIGFVLRAVDDKNYYLLQISGASAPEPHTATLYAVKKGVLQPLNSATTVNFAKTLAADTGFRVIIRGDETGFTVSIEDSKTGLTHAVGLLTDQYNTYKKGAVGIGALHKSNFEVNYFEVCYSKCPK